MDKPHKRLDVWKLSVALARRVYQVTATFPPEERYGLAAQLRRASVGIASNLAEGAARSSAREFKQFLSIARGSLSELDTQLDLAMQLNLIPDATRQSFDPMLVRVDKMLYALQRKQALSGTTR